MVAHDHNPPHSTRSPNCDWLATFVIFVWPHTTHYYLESSGQVAYMKHTLRAGFRPQWRSAPFGRECPPKTSYLKHRPIWRIRWKIQQKNASSWNYLEVKFLVRDVGEPTHTLVPCLMPKPLAFKEPVYGLFRPNPCLQVRGYPRNLTSRELP